MPGGIILAVGLWYVATDAAIAWFRKEPTRSIIDRTAYGVGLSAWLAFCAHFIEWAAI